MDVIEDIQQNGLFKCILVCCMIENSSLNWILHKNGLNFLTHFKKLVFVLKLAWFLKNWIFLNI